MQRVTCEWKYPDIYVTTLDEVVPNWEMASLMVGRHIEQCFDDAADLEILTLEDGFLVIDGDTILVRYKIEYMSEKEDKKSASSHIMTGLRDHEDK